MKVVCVLRSGGDYLPEHVYRLQEGVARFLPGAEFVCLSDLALDCDRIALMQGWPGWWSKMELFAPRVGGDLLYLDLDTVLVGDLAPLVEAAAAQRSPVLMRDVYRPKGLQSSIMWIPDEAKDQVWGEFSNAPRMWMDVERKGGDQAFLERFWITKARRWQDIIPGAVVSWKVDCRRGAVPAGASVVAFHGKPRPWATPLWRQMEAA